MKILYVDLKYHYGVKDRGINQIGIDGFQNGFSHLGHEVIPFYYDKYVKNSSPLQAEILKKARSTKPDLIFFSLFENQFAIETLAALKKEFTTINWFGDDAWRFDAFTKKYSPYFTYAVTTDHLAISKYKKNNVASVLLSQWAAPFVSDTNQLPKQDGYKYDVSFIGGTQSYRKWFISHLAKNGIKVNCFGNGWKNGVLTNAEMGDVFAQSKINLNLSNSISYDLRYIFCSLRAFADVIRGKKIGTQIKARNFEINYFGGFQITEYVNGLEQYYSIGKELVCYQNIDDAIPLIRYYLDHDEKREAICLAGNKRALAQHSYYHRLQKLLTQVRTSNEN